MKKNILVVFLLLIIAVGFIQVNLFYSKETLYIKDFETVSENYSKIRDMLFEYYNKENYSEKIILDIDKSAFEIIDGDKKINMNDEEKNSLKKICETSYKVHYNFIWVTENYIIFWEDETKMYGVIYTNDFKEAKRDNLNTSTKSTLSLPVSCPEAFAEIVDDLLRFCRISPRQNIPPQ